MSAALKLTNFQTTIPEEAISHIEVLTELLRDVNLEQRMETLIKAECFLKKEEESKDQLQLIRNELEEELFKMRKMIFMVERAQYLIETSR